jgi:hypothetical protein
MGRLARICWMGRMPFWVIPQYFRESFVRVELFFNESAKLEMPLSPIGLLSNFNCSRWRVGERKVLERNSQPRSVI